jgi:hypothetical protein
MGGLPPSLLGLVEGATGGCMRSPLVCVDVYNFAFKRRLTLSRFRRISPVVLASLGMRDDPISKYFVYLAVYRSLHGVILHLVFLQFARRCRRNLTCAFVWAEVSNYRAHRSSNVVVMCGAYMCVGGQEIRLGDLEDDCAARRRSFLVNVILEESI